MVKMSIVAKTAQNANAIKIDKDFPGVEKYEFLLPKVANDPQFLQNFFLYLETDVSWNSW